MLNVVSAKVFAVALMCLWAITYATAGPPEAVHALGYRPTGDLAAHPSGEGGASLVATGEWLGPLAPIALSPYFGMTCLAGMAQFGSGTWVESNEFVSNSPVLRHPAVFWVFLALTLLTSLPRFFKVSKPVVQLLDQLETWSVLVTLIILRVAANQGAAPPAEIHAAGIGTVTWELLWLFAAVTNVIVISTVRFVCELAVWLSPIPLVDAAFELANKGLAATLMAIYSVSPLLALALNLVLFAICGWLFLPMVRWANYFRTMMIDPILVLVFPSMAIWHPGELMVFNRRRLGRFPPRSCLWLRRQGNRLILRRANWWGGSTEIELQTSSGPPELSSGLFINKIILPGDPETELIFSKRYAYQLPAISEHFGLRKSGGVCAADGNA